MIPGLTGLPSVSTSVSSKSGDANAGGYDGAFQYNAAFQVGGSGSTTQSNDATQAKTPTATGGSSPILVYVALGLGVLALLLSALSARRA
jgi:hypothetical protein